MAFYKDSATSLDVLDKIIEKLTTTPQGATSPYWTKVQSGTFAAEGYILFSSGKSGKESIYIQFTAGTDPYFNLRMIEKYTPNAVQGLTGTMVNAQTPVKVAWYYNITGSGVPIDYWLSFDRDKIMMAVSAGKYLTQGLYKTFTYIGIPERAYGPVEDPPITATIHAASRNAYALTGIGATSTNLLASMCQGLRSRSLGTGTNALYAMRTITGINSKGWGGKITLFDIFLESAVNTEGIRFRLDGVYTLNGADFRDGDEIAIGSKRYTIHGTYAMNTIGGDVSCFPTIWLAVEQI